MIRWLPLLLILAIVPRVESAEAPPPVEVVIHPAEGPEPSLKYRLIPDDDSLKPGNAALFYHRGIELMDEARRGIEPGKSDEGLVADWLLGPLKEIPIDRARAWLDRNRNALHEAELGARCRDCDWGLDDRPEGFSLVIPDLQAMRSFIRLVGLRARLDVIEGHPMDALRWLQTGEAMSRHACRARFAVPMLIGVFSSIHLNRALLDVIEAPGTPSLYWALMSRPRPFIDPSGPMEGERLYLEREIPQLRELDGLPWSVAKARAFAEDLETHFYRLSEWSPPARMGWGDEETGRWLNRLGIAALVARSYPEARRSLIARGRSVDQVEAMPTIQVAFLDAYLGYQVYRDDRYRWTWAPYQIALQGLIRSEDKPIRFEGQPLLKFLCSLTSQILPALQATLRCERQLDAIACIEAIRIFAAKHGRFPARLDEITETPAPIDPMNGHPFAYRLEGDRAILSAPEPAGYPANFGFSLRYELKLAH